jgi:hypothetical protein
MHPPFLQGKTICYVQKWFIAGDSAGNTCKLLRYRCKGDFIAEAQFHDYHLQANFWNGSLFNRCYIISIDERVYYLFSGLLPI